MGKCTAVNKFADEAKYRRFVDLKSLEAVVDNKDIVSSSVAEAKVNIELALEKTWTSNIPFLPLLEVSLHSPTLDKPLSACILDIIWELLKTKCSLTILQSESVDRVEPLNNLILLLCSAAQYQTSSDEVSLPNYSLLC